MQTDSKHILQSFRPAKIIFPVLIGLAPPRISRTQTIDKDAFARIQWSWNSSFWIAMALLMMVVRDVAT
jgi:hypothetical protein